MSDVYFFGCWNGSIGHYLVDAHGRWVPHEATPPWDRIDGALCPRSLDRYGRETERSDQHEGHAALHHKDGWTALAWWDRSVDTRFGSNAALFTRGAFTAEEMLALGSQHFPKIMSRFKYAISTELRK